MSILSALDDMARRRRFDAPAFLTHGKPIPEAQDGVSSATAQAAPTKAPEAESARTNDAARNVVAAGASCSKKESLRHSAELVGSDPYARRVQTALQQINRPDYPAGMINWLQEASPLLYEELTGRLPDEIHDLWSEHAPLLKFEDVLRTLVETHQSACQLYRTYLAADQRPTEEV